MGAELVGYFVFMPSNGMSIINKQKSKIKKALRKKDWADAVANLGVDTGYFDNEQTDDNKEIVKIWLNELTLSGFRARDVNSMTITINGKKIDIFYAGERTWGGAPDGGGYNLFDRLYLLGIGDVLYNSINWGKKCQKKRKRKKK